MCFLGLQFEVSKDWRVVVICDATVWGNGKHFASRHLSLQCLCLLSPETGGCWNTKGCQVVSKQYGYSACYCNHTTNFALLLQVYEVEVTILCSISNMLVRAAVLVRAVCATYLQLTFHVCWCVRVCVRVCVSAEPGKWKSFAGADVYRLWSVSVWPPLHLHPLHRSGVSHKCCGVHSGKRTGWKAFHKIRPGSHQ